MARTKAETPNGKGKANGKGQTAEAPDYNREDRETVNDLLGSVKDKLKDSGFKPTVNDLIRLLQFRQDLEAEQAKEITVTWKEPAMDRGDSNET